MEDLGIRYFDVAPEYGDGVAQARLGPALEPFRARCFLAAKTMFRDAASAAKVQFCVSIRRVSAPPCTVTPPIPAPAGQDLATSLAALRTEYLDLYQLHSISSVSTAPRLSAQQQLQPARSAHTPQAPASRSASASPSLRVEALSARRFCPSLDATPHATRARRPLTSTKLSGLAESWS